MHTIFVKTQQMQTCLPTRCLGSLAPPQNRNVVRRHAVSFAKFKALGIFTPSSKVRLTLLGIVPRDCPRDLRDPREDPRDYHTWYQIYLALSSCDKHQNQNPNSP